MKRLTLTLLVSGLAIFTQLIGCQKPNDESEKKVTRITEEKKVIRDNTEPKGILLKYLSARFNNNYEEAYQYVASEEKSTQSLQEYLDRMEKIDTPMVLAMRSKVTWEIKEFGSLHFSVD